MKKRPVLLLILILTVFLSGCRFFDPPSPEDADAFLKNNQHDLDVVVDYLKSLNTDHAYIDKYSERVFYEFEYHKIISNKVIISLQYLWKAGCECISIQNGDNTVFFRTWSRTWGEQDSGISCTINGQGFPKAEFQTNCIPISNGWFYYFSNYEEYRKSPSKYDEMWAAETVHTP